MKGSKIIKDVKHIGDREIYKVREWSEARITYSRRLTKGARMCSHAEFDLVISGKVVIGTRPCDYVRLKGLRVSVDSCSEEDPNMLRNEHGRG